MLCVFVVDVCWFLVLVDRIRSGMLIVGCCLGILVIVGMFCVWVCLVWV